MRHPGLRALLLLVVVSVVVSACSSPSSHAVDAEASGPRSAALVPSPLAGAGELSLPPLVADLGSAPGGWTEVLAVPFGPGPAALGFESGSEASPRGPTSFAVVDGAVWIADPVKHRLVRFALSNGALLDAIRAPLGAPLGDLVALGGSDPAIWVVLDGRHGTIAPVSASGLGAPLTVHDAGVRYRVTFLLSDHARLLAEVAGAGETGVARIDTRDGSIARWAPGVPAGGAVAVEVGTGADGGGLEVHWFHYQHQLAKGLAPIELRSAQGSAIPAVAGARLEALGPGGAIAWVQVSAAAGGRGGAWMAAIPPDPASPIRFERLPTSDVPSTQARSLAVDAGGDLWLLVTGTEGIRLFRRSSAGGA